MVLTKHETENFSPSQIVVGRIYRQLRQSLGSRQLSNGHESGLSPATGAGAGGVMRSSNQLTQCCNLEENIHRRRDFETSSAPLNIVRYIRNDDILIFSVNIM